MIRGVAATLISLPLHLCSHRRDYDNRYIHIDIDCHPSHPPHCHREQKSRRTAAISKPCLFQYMIVALVATPLPLALFLLHPVVHALSASQLLLMHSASPVAMHTSAMHAFNDGQHKRTLVQFVARPYKASHALQRQQARTMMPQLSLEFFDRTKRD